MKKFFTIHGLAFFLLFATGSTQLALSKTQSEKAGKELRTMNNNAFQIGEKLKYRIHYGVVSAGYAELNVEPTDIVMHGNKLFHVVAKGRSTYGFDPFFKVRDTYETYIDQDAILPWMFFRDCYEGGYTVKQNVIFNHFANTAKSNKQTISTPENVQDIVSVFYYARCIDFSNVKVGDFFNVSTHLDDEVFDMKFKYVGKAEVKTDVGKIKCLKFLPILLQGRVFKNEEDMVIYVSDDENKIPVLVKAEVMIGSIKMTLNDYSGLRNPFLSLVKK